MQYTGTKYTYTGTKHTGKIHTGTLYTGTINIGIIFMFKPLIGPILKVLILKKNIQQTEKIPSNLWGAMKYMLVIYSALIFM